MFPSFIIHAKLIGKLILIKYLMMDVSLVESVDIDNINASLAMFMLILQFTKSIFAKKSFVSFTSVHQWSR